MSTLATTNIKHPSSASNNIVLDSAGGVDLDALTVSGSAPADSVNIDASGRLLVGTSTSASGGNAQYSLLQVVGNSAGGANFGVFNVSRNENSADISLNEPIGLIIFGDKQAGEYAEIRASADGAAGAGDYPGRLSFSTTADAASSPTERMRLHSTGRLQVQGSDGQMFALGSTLAAGTTNYLFVCGHSATSFGAYTSSFVVYTNGNVQNTNGSYTTISDVKLKENIVDAGSQWDDFKAIQIRNWNFKAETGHETHRQIGPIAQELEQVCPGLVFETPDRDADGNDLGTVTKGVNQSVLYMKAVKALQEAMERIEQLEAKVAALEAA